MLLRLYIGGMSCFLSQYLNARVVYVLTSGSLCETIYTDIVLNQLNLPNFNAVCFVAVGVVRRNLREVGMLVR